jgi:hypothetical protein
MEKGDIIAILYGSNVPIVLRPNPTETSHFLIGECYVHGIMLSEAIRALQKNAELTTKTETFLLK